MSSIKKEKKSILLQFRVTPTEGGKIMKWAMESEMEMPDYLRKVILRGVTFRVEVSEPETLIVKSTKINRIDDDEEQPKRRHAAG